MRCKVGTMSRNWRAVTRGAERAMKTGHKWAGQRKARCKKQSVRDAEQDRARTQPERRAVASPRRAADALKPASSEVDALQSF